MVLVAFLCFRHSVQISLSCKNLIKLHWSFHIFNEIFLSFQREYHSLNEKRYFAHGCERKRKLHGTSFNYNQP